MPTATPNSTPARSATIGQRRSPAVSRRHDTTGHSASIESPSAMENQCPPGGLCLREASSETTRYIQSNGGSGKYRAAITTPTQNVPRASANAHAAIVHRRRSEEHTSELQSQSNL